MSGFGDRAPVEQVIRWLDEHGAAGEAEAIALAQSSGRVLAAGIHAPADSPASDRTAEDGYAVRAQETIGAGDYNPLPLALLGAAEPLRPGAAIRVAAGEPLPAGADAVLPLEAARAEDALLEVFAPAAVGAGIERRGQEAAAGEHLFDQHHVLRPADLALLAALGVERVPVWKRPHVRLVIAGAKRGTADADGPPLAALVARDGGTVERAGRAGDYREAIRSALASPGADLVLLVGRSGLGPDDDAPAAIAAAGSLALHGIAVEPGGSTGVGLAGGVPVILLPGEPFACLCAYELFAGRLIRRLGGRDPELPYIQREVELTRKLVSSIGTVDLFPVRLAGDRAEPLGRGIAAAARAEGFVIVPAPLEGYAPGSRVRVHMY